MNKYYDFFLNDWPLTNDKLLDLLTTPPQAVSLLEKHKAVKHIIATYGWILQALFVVSRSHRSSNQACNNALEQYLSGMIFIVGKAHFLR